MALLVAAPAGLTASPRNEILRHVPDDVGFCAVFTGLPAAVERIRESPFAAALSRAAARGAPGVKELEDLKQVSETVRKLLKLEWKELADIVPGEAFAFAYRPGPPGKPDQEQALFLLRSRDGKALEKLVNTLNALQQASGELLSKEDVSFKGVKYVRRVEKTVTNFYYLSGPVLLFTAQEAILKQAIEQGQALPKDAVPPMTARLQALGLEKAEAALVLCPRAFDPHLGAESKEAKVLAAYWKALDGAGLGLSVGRDAALTLALTGKTSKLPSAGRALFEGAASTSSLWGSFPDKALFALAARTDLTALYGAAVEVMTPENRKALDRELDRWITSFAGGKNAVKEIFPTAGPDWGICLLLPPAESKEAQPRFLAAIKLKPEEDVAAALGDAMRAWAHLALASLTDPKRFPGNTAYIATRGKGKDEVFSIEARKGLPQGVVPSWALRAGHLLVGTSPDLLAAFKPGSAPAGSILLARASASAWRQFLKEQRGPLTQAFVERDKVGKEEAEARLNAADTLLSLIDTVELTRHEGKSRVAFTLSIRFSAPLRKE
jgi:hypothetical protein